MGRSTKVTGASVPKQATRQGQTLASYVYGIVPADTKIPSNEGGLGDPAGKVRLARHGEIAALVSDVDVDQPLGRPGDFLAHERLCDAVAAKVAVLPFRFGAVVANDDAVVSELLEPHHDEFLEALSELEGQAEFIVKGRYVEQALMAEILAENSEAAALREAIRGTSEDATRNERIRLGEIIANTIEMKRATDTQMLTEALAGHYSQAVIREPTHEQDAVNVAMLVEMSDKQALERALGEFGEGWAGRVELRLLGPLAPYDFVIAQEEGT
ncbi:GvpL/GvpF family gas vesicle protein [Nonomuraea turkmeniaca]|uniref:GvpL/GvpF family gas vesicle protein n=1 Tax=Nonomuraea turkmeniaca TaxID=103838 RepID=A0A5S4FBP9_9ACTN|nr:GvpL/GvpF family gas vesicle protein [Nonomuraea turkmeniaca]TMR15343.1 GvpL/GvpF family gas vesicle protein [Nonomuraea turkmeniaca]